MSLGPTDEFSFTIHHKPGRPPTEAEIKACYDVLGNTPIIWRNYGRFLASASTRLCGTWLEALRSIGKDAKLPAGDPFGELMPAMMLRGMAIECYLKALGLERGKFVLAVDGALNKNIPKKDIGALKKHDLVALAELVDFQLLNDAERRSMLEFSRAITRGRYPIPTKWQDYARLTSDGMKIGVYSAGTIDAVSERILKRLMKTDTPA